MFNGDPDDTPAASEAEPSPNTGGEGRSLEERMGSAPPMALLAAIAAVLHVFAKRLLLPAIIGQGAVVPKVLTVIPTLTLNIACVAATVSLAAGLLAIVSDGEFTHPSRRVVISLLGSLVIAASVAASVLPDSVFPLAWVLLTAASVHALTVQLTMAALRQHASLAGRTTAATAAAASLFPIGSMLVRHMGPVAGHSLGVDGAASLHGLGELSFLAMPIAAAFCVAPWQEHAQAKRARQAGAAAVFIMGILFAAASRLPAEDYGHLLYSTLRLEWALDSASLGYAVPVSLAAGAATAALLSPDTRHRQGGIGLWLWLAAGYNPLSPARLLLWALAATLLSRALIALRYEREGTGATEAV